MSPSSVPIVVEVPFQILPNPGTWWSFPTPIHTQRFSARVEETSLRSVQIRKMMTVMVLMYYGGLDPSSDYVSKYIPATVADDGDDEDVDDRYNPLYTICSEEDTGEWSEWCDDGSFKISPYYHDEDVRHFVPSQTDVEGVTTYSASRWTVSFDADGFLHSVRDRCAFQGNNSRSAEVKIWATHGLFDREVGPAVKVGRTSYHVHKAHVTSVE